MSRTTRWPAVVRLGPPIALIVGGFVWLSGCFPWPGDFKTIRGGGERPETRLGVGTSGGPLKVSTATRADVVAVLGEPVERTADEDVWLYRYDLKTSSLVFPLCFAAWPDYHGRDLFLQFDAQGRLSAFATRRPEEPDPFGGRPRMAPNPLHGTDRSLRWQREPFVRGDPLDSSPAPLAAPTVVPIPRPPATSRPAPPPAPPPEGERYPTTSRSPG
jgi:hypothetical protein